VGLSLQNISTEVSLYIGAAKGPVVGCRTADSSCRWCLVAMEVIVVAAGATMEALTFEVPSLTREGRL
jgi:hypothetical protein